jgi:hypothetical protein
MTGDLEALAELGGAAAVEMVASALADHGENAAKCPNCGAPVIGPFCAACGQERNTHRRSVRALFGELLSEIASFDSRILRTAKALLIQPGELSLAFHDGRPRRYVPALRLYLFVSLIFFLTLSAAGLAIVQFQLVTHPEKIVTNAKGQSFAITQDDSEPAPIADWKAKEPGPHYSISSELHMFAPIGAYHNVLPPQAIAALEDDKRHAEQKIGKNKTGNWIKTHAFKTVAALATDPAAINGPLTIWIPRVLFLLLPIFALVLAAFYWRQRKKFYFVDHLVFSLNMHSFVFAVILIAAGLSQLIPGEFVAWAVLASVGVYQLLAMRRFYRQNWFWTAAKLVSVSFVYTVFVLLPAMAVVISVSFLGL